MSGNNMENEPPITPDSEVFLLSFIGEMVQVLTDFTLTSSQTTENPNDGSLTSEDSNHPLIVEGYLLDSDENYVYLGPDPNEIQQALKKDKIVFIQILDKKDPLTDIMDSLTGKSRKDMN